MKEEGIDWDNVFPNSPYEVQRQLADAVYSSLYREQHRLLIVQSPTGTGKTYSLLAPTLYWLNKPQSAPTSSLPSWLLKSKLTQLTNKHETKLISMGTVSTFKLNKSLQINQNIKINTEGAKKVGRKQFIKEQDDSLKIIYASRTHSQLQQVMKSAKQIAEKMNIKIKSVHIASKDYTCINSEIKKQSNIQQKCKNLLQNKGCSHYHNNELSDFLNLTIEQSISLGTEHGVCPYYALRNIVSCCDLICVPYSSLLDADIRRKSNISLKNSIVILDQAHNILDFDRKMRSFEASTTEINILCQCLDEYIQKIKDKYLMEHWLTILRAMLKVVKNIQFNSEEGYIKIQIVEWLLSMEVAEIKVWKIKKYVQANDIDSRLASLQPKLISVKIINQILNLLLKICVHQNEQKNILLIKGKNIAQSKIKIMCLESNAVSEIISQSKLTIMAGGTMEPIDDFSALLSKVSSKILKYNHIIQKNQFTIYTVAKYQKKEIKFTYEKLTNDLNFLIQVANDTLKRVQFRTEKAGGIVIFVQSAKVIRILKDHLHTDYEIYYDDDTAFQRYKKAIDSKKQAILVSVMGGRLSEGINFTDQYARGLIVFGLPYPNMFSPQIKEMMLHCYPKPYYEHLCFKTLNQTIGRAVRHSRDYAVCYLIDARFQDIKIQLSQWMRDYVQHLDELRMLSQE